MYSPKIPEKFIGEAIKEVVAHEVGHTLGLRHNFKASSIYSLADINSPAIKGQKPFAGSVMDYLPINVVLDEDASDWPVLWQRLLGRLDVRAADPQDARRARLQRRAAHRGSHCGTRHGDVGHAGDSRRHDRHDRRRDDRAGRPGSPVLPPARQVHARRQRGRRRLPAEGYRHAGAWPATARRGGGAAAGAEG